MMVFTLYCSASSLKQQLTIRHVELLRHIPISVQADFALTPEHFLHSREIANTNFIVYIL